MEPGFGERGVKRGGCISTPHNTHSSRCCASKWLEVYPVYLTLLH